MAHARFPLSITLLKMKISEKITHGVLVRYTNPLVLLLPQWVQQKSQRVSLSHQTSIIFWSLTFLAHHGGKNECGSNTGQISQNVGFQKNPYMVNFNNQDLVRSTIPLVLLFTQWVLKKYQRISLQHQILNFFGPDTFFFTILCPNQTRWQIIGKKSKKRYQLGEPIKKFSQNIFCFPHGK